MVRSKEASAISRVLVLHEGKQCNAAGDECKDIVGKRLWSGTEWQVEFPFTTPVSFSSLGPEGKGKVEY